MTEPSWGGTVHVNSAYAGRVADVEGGAGPISYQLKTDCSGGDHALESELQVAHNLPMGGRAALHVVSARKCSCGQGNEESRTYHTFKPTGLITVALVRVQWTICWTGAAQKIREANPENIQPAP